MLTHSTPLTHALRSHSLSTGTLLPDVPNGFGPTPGPLHVRTIGAVDAWDPPRDDRALTQLPPTGSCPECWSRAATDPGDCSALSRRRLFSGGPGIHAGRSAKNQGRRGHEG